MIEEFKKEFTSKVEKIVADAEKAERVENPVFTPDVKRMLDEEIGKFNVAVQKNWDMTRQMVQRDVKGLL